VSEKDQEAPEPFTVIHGAVLAVGLLVYGLGFNLLSNDYPNTAPLVIVGGIVTMLISFFV
jgi:hypothetical protein